MGRQQATILLLVWLIRLNKISATQTDAEICCKLKIGRQLLAGMSLSVCAAIGQEYSVVQMLE